MADRYWVGGTGTWNQTSTANWSTTSGGSAGASAPTPTDAVYIDANSGGGTVDVQDAGGATLPCCAALDFTDFTGTFDSSSGVLEVFGDITLSTADGSDFTLFTPNIYGTSCTLNTNGRAIKDLYAGGVSVTTELEYSPTVTVFNTGLTCNGIFVFSQGTFTSSGYSIYAQYFLWGTAGAVKSTTINMQDGYFAITNSVSPGEGWSIWYHTSPSEVTVNINDYSYINFVNQVASAIYLYNGATGSISSLGKTYRTLNVGDAGALGGVTIYGDNTFYTISNGVQPVTVTFAAGSTQTVTLFELSGTSGNLVTLNSTSPGTQFTLYRATGLVSVDYVSLQDSAVTGDTIWYAGAHSTNVSNNTGWTFTAQPPVNRYWVGGSGTWDVTNVTNWSATSGGAGGAYAPTSIDAVFIDANSGGGTIGVVGSVDAGSLDCTGFTGTLTSDYYATPRLLGNLTLNATATYDLWFGVFGSTILTSNGAISSGLKPRITVSDGTLTLGDDISFYNIVILNNSTFSTNNHNVTTNLLEIYEASTLNLGSSSITLSYFIIHPEVTLNAGTSTINMRIDVQDPYDWEFYGGDHTYYNLNFLTDADTDTGYGGVYDNNTFHSITNSVQPIDVIFQSGYTQTITGTFGVSGTAGNLVTLRSTLPGTQFTLVKASGTVSSDYLSLQDSNATGGAAWYAGTHSTDVSNNTGWTFTAPPGGSIPISIGVGLSIGSGITIG